MAAASDEPEWPTELRCVTAVVERYGSYSSAIRPMDHRFRLGNDRAKGSTVRGALRLRLGACSASALAEPPRGLPDPLVAACRTTTWHVAGVRRPTQVHCDHHGLKAPIVLLDRGVGVSGSSIDHRCSR